MKRALFLLLLSLMVAPTVLPATAHQDTDRGYLADKQPAKESAPKTYICSMCKDVKSDKPGKCPHCGMDLKEEPKQHKGKIK